MTTTLSPKRPAPQASSCSCRGIEHTALCPSNPDPSICDLCAEAYDPAEDGASGVWGDCPDQHCPTCSDRCRECTRQPAGIGRLS